ncbi:uncharacterized protein BDZ99DRAFT_569596 [Mytilinidion resinicola]|uniref:Uncharacterized protein n=1 Tax=Mytilinidion resinicola TaxID=574789 RepID=A0A6A6YT97_9PEZI|nr:uncharacterized protein BDZ99DRAFT_569596 [Mytilinidion resinicola]KAF2811593.1 hypothetical protein BDZ99DRAFT_569596 [Mytilinidion resinicola]
MDNDTCIELSHVISTSALRNLSNKYRDSASTIESICAQFRLFGAVFKKLGTVSRRKRCSIEPHFSDEPELIKDHSGPIGYYLARRPAFLLSYLFSRNVLPPGSGSSQDSQINTVLPAAPPQPAQEAPQEQSSEHKNLDDRDQNPPALIEEGPSIEEPGDDHNRDPEAIPTTPPEAEALERPFGEEYDPSNAPSPRWADTNIVELAYDPSAPKRAKVNTREIDPHPEARAGNLAYSPDQDPRSVVDPSTDLAGIPLEQGQLWYQCVYCEKFVKIRTIDGIVEGEWRVRESLKCRNCGCKAMYKVRTRRMVQFDTS